MNDELQRRNVAPGEAVRLVAAFRRAVHAAARLRVGLIVDGVDTEDMVVAPAVSEDGHPAVHLTAAPVEAVWLSELVVHDKRPPPEEFPPYPRGDPNVA